jgi:hypothetical protein
VSHCCLAFFLDTGIFARQTLYNLSQFKLVSFLEGVFSKFWFECLPIVFFGFFFFFVGLEFEFTTSCLPDSCSNSTQPYLVVGIFEIGFLELFAHAGFESLSS